MIDAHVHCFPKKLALRALHGASNSGRFGTDGTIEDQLSLAKREGIRKIIVLNFASRPDTMADVNQYAIENNGRAGIVVSFGTVHPYAENAIEELMRLYDAGIRGIKFQPIQQRFDVDDACCRPLFSSIGKLGMMTVIHGGRSTLTKEHPVLPQQIAKCIDYFQGNPVILSHMGGMFLTRTEIDYAASLPVITDTAYSAHHMDQDTFCYAFGKFGVDRVLFGTDLPWADLAREKAFVERLHLSENELNKVYDRNAERYLTACGALERSIYCDASVRCTREQY